MMGGCKVKTELNYLTVNYRSMEKVAVPEECVAYLVIDGVTSESNHLSGVLQEEREVAKEVHLIVGVFGETAVDSKSVIYSDNTPYERLMQDKTIESITLNYRDGETEEFYVPYTSDNPDTIGENTSLIINVGDIGDNWIIPKTKGIELKFGKEDGSVETENESNVEGSD